MSFAAFSLAFTALYDKPHSSTGLTLRGYLAAGGAKGDEASVVDNVLTGPLLEMLGFPRTDQTYNQQKKENRPDFAPSDPEIGLCFFVEDKATGEALSLDLDDQKSHLSQLRRYALAEGGRFGLLSNGKLILGFRFDGERAEPLPLFSLNALEPDENALRALYELFHRAAFTDAAMLESALSLSEEDWKAQARPVGEGFVQNQLLLVEALRELVRALADDARRLLAERLARADEFRRRAAFLDDEETEHADASLKASRQGVATEIGRLAGTFGLKNGERAEIDNLLATLERDPAAFPTPKALEEAVKDVLNRARALQAVGEKAVKPFKSLGEIDALQKLVEGYARKALRFHQRRNALSARFRESLGVREDYDVWTSLVQETMLGGLSEEERRAEFALQAAYVVAIRLLLIRVCEDKGILKHRILSDGGVAVWQGIIERYFQFANGNPYAPLLELAYQNAQNIYAHFFTGRELFNWFTLERRVLILSLSKLNGFDLADVDADIIGSVYETYLSRKERKKRGQFYTPREIVDYLLDGVGYAGGNIAGQNKRLLDPACGSGSFLVAATRRLLDAYKPQAQTDPAAILEKVRSSIYGFDLNPFACYLAEVNLLIQVLPLVKAIVDKTNRPPRLQRFHLYNVDALALPSDTYHSAQVGATLMAAERDEVEAIKERKLGSEYANGFAFVVGNPPYGASLTDSYKAQLKIDYAGVFRGQPDTYVFFYQLGVRLLSSAGKLGFITPNTFLMGTNTGLLRQTLMASLKIDEIVDLPQGIWPDAVVDCVLLVGSREASDEAREAHTVSVRLMNLKDSLKKLTAREWKESLAHVQGRWMDADKNSSFEMPIRYDALLEKIEKACLVETSTGVAILRLGEVTESSQGIIPYKTKADGEANLYIRPKNHADINSDEWKPLLDASGYVGRYEIHWGEDKPYLKYGSWLWCAREDKYFVKPKILVQDMRNRSLVRRLVGAFDDQKFVNRHNFNNIIEREASGYSLKYILALFNSALLNYFFARRFDNLHVNPSFFRDLPIVPASAQTQEELASKVDQMLAMNKQLGDLRDRGYRIVPEGKKPAIVEVPYQEILRVLQDETLDYPLIDLFDAETKYGITLNEGGDPSTTISGNVFCPARFPQTLVLRRNVLWLTIPDDFQRQYLSVVLANPAFEHKAYADIRAMALLPDGEQAVQVFQARLEQEEQAVHNILANLLALDRQIDEDVLTLYKIEDSADRDRILRSIATSDDTTDEAIAETWE